MEEIWKDINGYEGLYQVSNTGRVRSLDRYLRNTKKSFRLSKSKLVAITDNGKGYKIVSLSNNGRKNHYVHRLVAEHFIEKPMDKTEVNHINGIKSDNVVSNLEWATRLENMNHSAKTGLMRSGAKCYLSKKVINFETGKIYDSITIAARENNINYSTLLNALKKRNTYKKMCKYSYYQIHIKTTKSHANIT